MPPKATTAQIKFDKKDVKFNTKAVPGCDQSQLANTTTETALTDCGNAKVGTGNATAALPFGTGGTRQDFPVVVTAFNRARREGHPAALARRRSAEHDHRAHRDARRARR